MDITTTIGFLAAALTTSCIIPQAVKTLKSKQTKDISLLMYSTLVAGVFLWMVYGIIRIDLPLIIANAITFILAGLMLGLKIQHG